MAPKLCIGGEAPTATLSEGKVLREEEETAKDIPFYIWIVLYASLKLQLSLYVVTCHPLQIIQKTLS